MILSAGGCNMRKSFILSHLAAYPFVVLNDMIFIVSFFMFNPGEYMFATIVTQLLLSFLFFVVFPYIYSSRRWKKLSAPVNDSADAIVFHSNIRGQTLRSTAVIAGIGLVYALIEILLIFLSDSKGMLESGLFKVLIMISSYCLVNAYIIYIAVSRTIIKYRAELFSEKGHNIAPGRGRLGLKLFVMLCMVSLLPLTVIILNLAGASYFSEFTEDNFNVINDVALVSFCLLFAMFFLTRSFVRPVEMLSGYFEKVRQGDYSVRAPVLTDDEVGRLSLRFNQMTAGLEEKEFIKTTFGKYIGTSVVAEILSRKEDFSGQEREVTVLFTDIQNYTAIFESLDPRQTVSYLNEYFTEIVKIIDHNGGMVNKFIGDAIMALFNAPLDDTLHADHALQAALEIREYTQKAVFGENIVFYTRVGINSGTAITGTIGSLERLEYTAIGDTVNIAQRLEALNKKCGTQILLSESTAAMIREHDCVSVGIFRVKGRQKPVKVFTPAEK